MTGRFLVSISLVENSVLRYPGKVIAVIKQITITFKFKIIVNLGGNERLRMRKRETNTLVFTTHSIPRDGAHRVKTSV